MTHTPATPHLPRQFWQQPVFLGTALAAVSAVSYTATNVFLRSAAHCDPVWVSCVKAVPTVALLTPWLILQCGAQGPLFPRGTALATLIGAGILGQGAGNVLFQWSLGMVGMALTVPLCMGSIILCGAFLGRFFLNEPITRQTLISMIVLIGAIWALSLGANEAHAAVGGSGPISAPGLWLAAAVFAACFSGFAYAVLGVVIRYSVMGKASVAATTWTIALIGVLGLGSLSFYRVGWHGMSATSGSDWQAMLLAGVCNFVAFIALARSLQLITLIYVNALNASQVAMAAIAGLVLFDESSSPALVAGLALTVGGLVFMPRPGQTSRNRSSRRAPWNGRARSSKSDSASSNQAAKGPVSSSASGPATAIISSESTPLGDGK